MKPTFIFFSFAVLVATLCGSCLATPQYIITNNNGLKNNSASVYTLNATTGELSLVAILNSGGAGAGNYPAELNSAQAINSNGTCIFLANFGTNDISSFSKATDYKEVGRYTNSVLAFSGSGGSVAIAPNGRFLYASYSQSENLAAWTVNADCSLTLIDIYVPSAGAQPFSNLRVTPNGTSLVLPLSGAKAELFAIDAGSGQLLDKGYLDFEVINACHNGGCGFYGLDITKDSKVAVFAGTTNGKPSAFVSQITSHGLANPHDIFLTNSEEVTIPTFPIFDASGYAGNGNIFFSSTGGRGFPGIIAASFSENPPALSLLNATVVEAGLDGIGTLAVVDNVIVLAEFPNIIDVYSINADASVTLLNSVVDNNAEYPFSLSAVPNVR